MYSCSMGESSSSSNQITRGVESKPSLASYPPPPCFDPSGSSMEQASLFTSIEESIKESKCHWSEVGDFESNNEVAEVSNMELFKTLQAHPKWGSFFKNFGKGEDSYGELVIGEKFAEGGQAEIYKVQVMWYDPRNYEDDVKNSYEYVLKVFKEGTFLCHLQSQWPQGFLQLRANMINRGLLGLPMGVRFYSDVCCATFLEDGRFGFLMIKEKEDLRSLIIRRMLTRSDNAGPFSKRKALKAMYEIAFGMNQLHDRDIVHRDIKASNVLVSSNGCFNLADFECSVGVVGTGFWRAPEILEACKHRNVSTKPELFTKAADIYSYGMTCYEILTGKLPFEGHLWNEYNLVLQGQQPEVPSYVDDWLRHLLSRCWQSNPGARPPSQEILKVFVANSTICRMRDLQIQKHELERGTSEALEYRNFKFLEMGRSLRSKLRFPKLKRLTSCKKCHEC